MAFLALLRSIVALLPMCLGPEIPPTVLLTLDCGYAFDGACCTEAFWSRIGR